MRIFGLEITRSKALRPPPAARGGGWASLGRVREPFTGAWQRNIEIRPDTVMSFHADFACRTLIASDIAKCRPKLVERHESGVWVETANPAYSPVLRKPNTYQNRIQFFEAWLLSKLARGNTYVLKERDGRGVVKTMHVLNPDLVLPMVAPDGSVFYQLGADIMTGVETSVTVPAREIIHDRFNCFFHPLVGLSPIFANGLAAVQGLEIQGSSAAFFANGSQPGGVLTAPATIPPETAQRLKDHWESQFTGKNAGRVAVLGDGLSYEPLAVTAVDAQLIEQLKWTAEVVCSTYHVPPYKIGVGALPTYNNVQALNTEYYSQCLQVLIESVELCLDEAFGIGEKLGVEFDLDNLLRMDTAGLIKSMAEATGAGLMKPDEARSKMSLLPVKGGDTPYMQQQNWALADLARRSEIPALGGPVAAPQPAAAAAVTEMTDEQRAVLLAGYLRKELEAA